MWRFISENKKPANWITEVRPKCEDDDDEFELSSMNSIEHLDGIPWNEAPLPPVIHLCKEQSRGWIGFNYYGRCACGAIHGNSGYWQEKNQTRKISHQYKKLRTVDA